jgi:hypothetical protein
VVRTVALSLLLALAIAALLPPFFTHGRCTAEYDADTALIEGNRAGLQTLAQAESYLGTHAIRYTTISAEDCADGPPDGVSACSDGPLLIAWLPVRDRICSWYRDDKVTVQLAYDHRLALVRMQTDMSPYKKVQSRVLGLEFDWGS